MQVRYHAYDGSSFGTPEEAEAHEDHCRLIDEMAELLTKSGATEYFDRSIRGVKEFAEFLIIYRKQIEPAMQLLLLNDSQPRKGG